MNQRSLRLPSYNRQHAAVLIVLCVLVLTGCADVFLGTGTLLSNIGDGLQSAGQCLTPLEPLLLNEVFSLAAPLPLEDDEAVITDAPQPAVAAYLAEQIGSEIPPRSYLPLRLFQLEVLNQGDLVQIEPLNDRLNFIALYDANFTLVPGGQTRTFDGRRRTIEIPIVRDSRAYYLRIDLEFISEADLPVARICRQPAMASLDPTPQTVLLDFAGQSNISYRGGQLVPTDVAPFDDPVARNAAVEAFKAYFAPFDVMVITDHDPRPVGPVSVVYVGAATPPIGAFGLAELVDDRNRTPDDVAIVDTNKPELQLARLFGAETFGQSIGGIAAHEMGHLLGLYHVSDPDALMTGARCQGAGLDINRLLQRQFRHAPITFAASNFTEWTLGFQDPIPYLLNILGPAKE